MSQQHTTLVINEYTAMSCHDHMPNINITQEGKQASLDQLPFCTVAHQTRRTTDNSVVFEEYDNVDTGLRDVCYGRIQSIIEHSIYPGCPDTLTHVLIECDWYTPTGVTTPSGLLQVSFDEQLSTSNRWTFLKNMHRSSVALWPSYSQSPFACIPNTYVVVQHTATVLDIDDEHAHESDTDDGGEE
jgi:hypothetical protein